MAADQTEAAAVAELATRAAIPHELTDDVHAVIVPDGARLELVELEQYRDNPGRKKGAPILHDAESFVAYFNDHLELDRSVVYADVDAFAFVAVLNGHEQAGRIAGDVENGSPGWGDHRAHLTLRKTPEWKRWAGRDGNLGTQEEFAEHLENGVEQIVDPPAAELLELAQTFHATTTAAFRQATYLDSGARQIRYEETVDAKAGTAGTLTVPKSFSLALRPFEGSDVYRVEAKLRFRIRDGRLSIGYVLDRPDDVLRAAFGDVLDEIAAGVDRPVFRGRPE